MTDEKRREPRFDTLSLNLFVYDNLGNNLLGTLVNLSRSGLMILGNIESEPGGVLQIDLRNGSSPDAPILPLGIKVSWSSAANTAGSYWIGARIIDLTEEDREKFEIILREAEAVSA